MFHDKDSTASFSPVIDIFEDFNQLKSMVAYVNYDKIYLAKLERTLDRAGQFSVKTSFHPKSGLVLLNITIRLWTLTLLGRSDVAL